MRCASYAAFVCMVTLGALSGATPASAEMVYGRDQLTCFVEAVIEETGGSPDAHVVEAVVQSLETGPMTRAEFVLNRVESLEFRASVVAELYGSMLSRRPDRGGLAYWTSHYSTSSALAADILGSDEYFRSVAPTHSEYVTAVYRQILGRSPDAHSLSSWAAMASGAGGRRSFAAALWLSEESNVRRVDRMYARLLDRRPDRSGRTYWGRRLAYHDDLELAVQLMSSHEYVERAMDCTSVARAGSHLSPRGLIVGDSLTVGASRHGLNAHDLARDFVVDALDGRRIADGVRILQRTDLTKIDHVVFALGSNDFRATDGELSALIDRAVHVAGNTPITWVNVDSGAVFLGDSKRFNALLRVAERMYPTLAIADWDHFMATSPDNHLLRHDDGVHYNDQGNRVRAVWLASLFRSSVRQGPRVRWL